MAANDRPLSPALQIYRWHLLMALSILHRASGVLLALGSVVLVVWLLALAAGPETYAGVRAVIASLPGQAALFAWTAALFYHLCNGIRHLFWDAGQGYELGAAYASGYAVLAATVVLTLAAWGGACLILGGS